MWNLRHNDTLFHALTLPFFEHLVKHINTMPGKFKECDIKYDDNLEDTTVLCFVRDNLFDLQNTIDACKDVINDYFYNSENIENSMYFRPGLFNRLLSKAKDEGDRKRIVEENSFLIKRT